MDIPKNLKYTKEHEWLKLEDDIAYVGITNFAQSELGDIVFVELPSKGDIFSSGDIFGTIEAVKTVADLYAPASGEVLDVNENLESNPELINLDPYNKGWIIKLKISNSNKLDSLLDSDAYKGILS